MFAMHVHLVFVTKYRRRVFGAEHPRHLAAVFGAQLVEFNGETDHVHLPVNYPPTVAASNLDNSLKGVSARIMRRDHPDLARRFWRGHLWSPSHSAGSHGGAPMSVPHQHIDNQQRPVHAAPRTPIPPRPQGPGTSAKGLR